MQTIAEMFRPADVIAVAIHPIGSQPEREIVYRKKYRWRWVAKLNRNALGWHYEDGILLIFKVVNVGSQELV